MKGHVRRRGSGWVYVVELDRDVDGKRRQRWRSGFRTKREADSALTDALAALKAGEDVAPDKLTVGAFLVERWLPSAAATLRPGTLSLYETLVRVHIVPAIGGRRLQGLTGADLNRLYVQLAAEGSEEGRGVLGTHAVRRVHGVLHRALRDAVRWKAVARNVADDADPPLPSAQQRESRRGTRGSSAASSGSRTAWLASASSPARDAAAKARSTPTSAHVLPSRCRRRSGTRPRDRDAAWGSLRPTLE